MYICTATQKEYEGKPWITIDMERWDGLPGPVTLSSYLVYKDCLNKIPERHYELVLNKEDFNYLFPRSSIPISPFTTLLTETEINQLTNEEYHNYKEEVLDELYEKQLEEELDDSSDTDDIDDY